MPKTRRRNNGTGTLTRLDNGRWRAQMDLGVGSDGRRRRVSATGATRTEALNRARAKADERRRKAGDEPADMPTVGGWCRIWVEEIVRPRRSPNTYRVYEQRIRCGIIPAIGDIPLDRLRPSHALDLERRELRRRSAATARLAHIILREACDAAVRERLIDVNPLHAMEPVAPDVAPRPALTPEQAARVIRLEPDARWRLIWRLLLTCGMRVGELAAITPESVVERQGVICLEITWQLKNFPHVSDRSDLPRGFEARHLTGHWWLTRPKTRAGFRLIPLPADLGRDLKAWAADTTPGRPVFRSARGGPLGREGIRHAWMAALDRAGVPQAPLHSARHTAATLMARLGVPDVYRKALIGHANIDTTDMIYTHADAAMLVGAVDGVARLIGSARPSTTPDRDRTPAS